MGVRLIVSDIDGTLLPSGGRISPATRDAVRACRERGVEFVVASGRWYPSAREISAGQLGIEDGYMIICNGGAVVRSGGEVLMEDGLDAAQARYVYDLFQGAGVTMTSYVRGGIYRMRISQLHAFRLPERGGYFGGADYAVVDDDGEAFARHGLNHPYKMEAYSDDYALLDRLRAQLLAAGLSVNSAFPFNLEVMAPNTGKGRATRWLAEYLGVAREEIMAFGDYTNDLPMLESAGIPVAVGNAKEEVRRAARIIAPDCAADGVAKTLQKYVLGDEAL